MAQGWPSGPRVAQNGEQCWDQGLVVSGDDLGPGWCRAAWLFEVAGLAMISTADPQKCRVSARELIISGWQLADHLGFWEACNAGSVKGCPASLGPLGPFGKPCIA